jgi:hypothetical protein
MGRLSKAIVKPIEAARGNKEAPGQDRRSMCRKRQQVCHGRIPGAKVDFWSTAWLRLSHGATFSTESAQKLENVDCKSLSALRDRLVPIAIRELCDWTVYAVNGAPQEQSRNKSPKSQPETQARGRSLVGDPSLTFRVVISHVSKSRRLLPDCSLHYIVAFQSLS